MSSTVILVRWHDGALGLTGWGAVWMITIALVVGWGR